MSADPEEMEAGDLNQGESETQFSQPSELPPVRKKQGGGGGTRSKKRSQSTTRETGDEGDEEKQEVASHMLQAGGKKTRPINKVSHEDEQEAMEWYRDHPEFYAKKRARYLDTAYKTRQRQDTAW